MNDMKFKIVHKLIKHKYSQVIKKEMEGNIS